MGKHTRLAHARDFGQSANGEAFQTNLGGQAQGRIDDGGFGLTTFHQASPTAIVGGLRGLRDLRERGDVSNGHGVHVFKIERPCYFA